MAFIGLFLIMIGLVWLMYHYSGPRPADEARWAERRKNLADLEARNAALQETYAWIDQGRGVVRLPVARVMEITARDWADPAAGRSNLLARLEKAAPPAGSTQTNATPVSKAK